MLDGIEKVIIPFVVVTGVFLIYFIIKMFTIPSLIETTNKLLREQNDLLKKVQTDLETQKKSD